MYYINKNYIELTLIKVEEFRFAVYSTPFFGRLLTCKLRGMSGTSKKRDPIEFGMLLSLTSSLFHKLID